MKTKLLLLALCGLLCMGGCWKKPEDWPLYKINSEEIIAYTAFPQGSWWVYEAKGKGWKDSVYVTGYSREIVNDKLAKERLEISTTYYGSSGGTYSIFVQPFGSADAARYCCNASYTVLMLPVDKAIDTYADENFSMQGPIDTMRVRSTEFHQIFKAVHGQRYGSGKRIHEEYFAPNIGVIKRLDYDSTEWELIKYHINR